MKKIKLSKSKIVTGSIARISYGLSSLIFIIGSMALLALSLMEPSFFTGVKSKISDAAIPLVQVVQAPVNKAVFFVREISGLASLQERNAALTEENIRLKEWYLLAKSLKAENAQLKKTLNMQGRAMPRFVTTEILGDTSGPFAKSILIKVGSDKEITKNAAVIAPQGVLGRVIEAGENTARVLLLTDMNSRIPVVINNGDEIIHAVAAGQNTDKLMLLHLPKGQKIAEGAHITTSGMGGVYPENMPVGVVVAQKNGQLVVNPYADPQHISFVRVEVNTEK